MAHVHPSQSETFEALEGGLSLKAGGDRIVAQPGDVVTVTPVRRPGSGTPPRASYEAEAPTSVGEPATA